MKKLLFVITLVALFSCEKEPIYCWQCNQETNTTRGYYSRVFDICDYTESQIRDYEIQKTKDFGTTTVVVSCIKKEE